MSAEASQKKLREIATPSLHDEVYDHLRALIPKPSGDAVDLGAGTGAWSRRLIQLGFGHVFAFDQNRRQFQGDARFVEGNLNDNFSQSFKAGTFSLVSAIEVIEHVENPSHFLRQCSQLLSQDGYLILTTPNIESMPGRLKFLLSGRLRHFDQNGDKTHITPIDLFLLRRLAACAGLEVLECHGAVRYWYDNRASFIWLARFLAPWVRGSPYGACHLIILKKKAWCAD